MPTGLISTRPLKIATQTWTLRLSAEVSPGRAPVTPERSESLAELLTRIPGLRKVAVRPCCDGSFVQVDLAVDASDLTNAIDRAAACLRRCAMTAGLGRVVLVAAGAASGPPDRRG